MDPQKIGINSLHEGMSKKQPTDFFTPIRNEIGHLNHIPALDGIRGIAFMMVLLCHTYPALLHGGNFGVDLFFVLSGFLITSILLTEWSLNNSINLGRFYLRRGLRLLPALFLVVLAVLVYTIIMQSSSKILMTLADIGRIVVYIFNWQLAVDYQHIVDRHQEMYTHLWSLSVEEQFYFVWPCLVIILLRLPRPLVLLFLFVGIAAPACARLLLWEEGASLWIYFRTELRFDNLLYGAFVAWMVFWGFVPKGLTRVILSWAGLVALIVLLILARFDLLTNGYAYRGVMSLVALLSALLIASVIWCPLTPLKYVLELKPLRWIGRISYGLYLWHFPVVLMISRSHNITTNVLFRNVITVGTIFAIATISYYVIERPFLRIKNNIGCIKKQSLVIPPQSVVDEVCDSA